MSYIEIYGETDSWFGALTETEKRWVNSEVDRIHILPKCHRAWMTGLMRSEVEWHRQLPKIVQI